LSRVDSKINLARVYRRIMSSMLYDIISGVMDFPVSQINDESSPETIDNWDSFHGLILADELETRFTVKFVLEDLTSVKKVGDIKNNLAKYGILINDE
jgi:acyl carrier protein